MSNESGDGLSEALGQPVTQEEFGQMVGISQQAVSSLCKRGILLPDQSAQEWVRRYVLHLHDQIVARYFGRNER